MMCIKVAHGLESVSHVQNFAGSYRHPQNTSLPGAYWLLVSIIAFKMLLVEGL